MNEQAEKEQRVPINDPRYRRLRARLAIDYNKLDDEIAEAAMLIQEAAEGAADALRKRDGAKHTLDVVSAKTRRVLASGEEKMTEKALDAALQVTRTVREAQVAYDDAKLVAALWSALADSLRDKASLLRRAAELIVAGFMTPTTIYEDRRRDMAAQRRAAASEATRPEPSIRRRG